MFGRKKLIETLKESGQSHDIDKINQAIDLAISYHGDQTRASGEPYITHPIAVAQIIADMHLDTASVITAILHDTVEDTDLKIEQIEQDFGKDVANLVSGVTKLTRLEFKSDQMKQAENFRKLLLAMSEDIRVLLIKLSDRLHNMQTLHFIPQANKRQKIALETMEIFAPLAERIGMHQCKTELQDIAFEVLYPNVRDSILKRLNEIAHDGHELIKRIISEIELHLKSANIDAEVMGRQKTPYSIWMKMNQKNVGFDQLSDIMAFRIVVNELSECYHVLGIIHSKYKMVPDNFHDFISTPKNNGYQSIHTIVIGPMQQRIEVQIRTEEMHEIAEFGVAAHWRYKQQYSAPDGKQFRWIRELLYILDHAKDPEEFMSNTKLEMYYDQVFCFTPKGKLIAMPKGASAIDFAYSVHSEVGNHCSGVKVNGQLAPLKTILKNGDQVEIITNKTQTPNKDWESFVVTGRARSEIKKFIRQQSIEQYASLGKDMIEKSFKSANLGLEDVDIDLALQKFQKNTIEDLYCAVGEGNIGRDELVKLYKPRSTIADTLAIFSFKKKPEKSESISIKGLIPGMAIHYAGCCHPIPGDEILGIVHTGKGVTIHSRGCEYLNHLNKNDFEPISLSWDSDEEGRSFVARFIAKLANEPGGLAVMSVELAKEKCNITNFKIVSRTLDYFEVCVDVEVRSVDHLNSVIDNLRSKKEVIYAERFKS